MTGCNITNLQFSQEDGTKCVLSGFYIPYIPGVGAYIPGVGGIHTIYQRLGASPLAPTQYPQSSVEKLKIGVAGNRVFMVLPFFSLLQREIDS